ncbi:unnamed protein product, partial [marine sediment metagenome]
YQIAKDLLDQTHEMLIIEEGTLYPILRKLEDDRIVNSEREKEGRKRKFYYITVYGEKIYNYLSGFYSKLTEAIAPLFDVSVDLTQNKYLYCPACANKIDIQNLEAKYCDVCGHYIEKELDVIREAESFLRNTYNLSQLRVRLHEGKLARIELMPKDIMRVMTNENIENIKIKFKQLGFCYITIDLEGFRTGSLNEVLTFNEEE